MLAARLEKDPLLSPTDISSVLPVSGGVTHTQGRHVAHVPSLYLLKLTMAYMRIM